MSPYEWTVIFSLAACALAIAMWAMGFKIRKTKYTDINDIEKAGLAPKRRDL